MRRRLLFRPRRLRPVRRPRRRFTALKLLIPVLLLVGLFLLAESKLSPIVERLALSRVTYLAGKVINDAVNEQIGKNGSMYDDLIHLEKDVDGHITALRTDMIRINQFKSDIIGKVMDKINSIDRSELSVPIGNVLNGELLSGRGPRIPIVITPTGIAEAKFASVFKSAGINQTRHMIIIEVTVHISVLLPLNRVSTEVNSQVNVAETIIVGVVPDTYTYLEDTGQTPMEIYGDFDLEGNGD